jgi:hypothetical protein
LGAPAQCIIDWYHWLKLKTSNFLRCI